MPSLAPFVGAQHAAPGRATTAASGEKLSMFAAISKTRHSERSEESAFLLALAGANPTHNCHSERSEDFLLFVKGN
jgi:hypothetical protein